MTARRGDALHCTPAACGNHKLKSLGISVQGAKKENKNSQALKLPVPQPDKGRVASPLWACKAVLGFGPVPVNPAKAKYNARRGKKATIQLLWTQGAWTVAFSGGDGEQN